MASPKLLGSVVFVRLDTDLQLIYNITTTPDDGTDNYNKILSINYDDNNLVTCGSDHGYCQIRNLTDLSVLGDSATYVAAPTVEDSTVGFVAPGYDDKPMLYVGTSKRGFTYGDEIVSGRQLEGSIFRTVYYSVVQTSVDLNIYYQGPDNVIYITGFSYGGFSYFLTVQRLGRSDDSYISRIVRVCQARNNNYYDSYTEVTLQCNGPDGTSYNLLQAAHVMRPASYLSTSLSLEDGEHVLFAVFTKGETPQNLTPLQQSAVCMYKMTDIEQTFRNAISGCVNQGGVDYELDYISGAACPGIGGYTEGCSTGGLYRFLNGIDPLSIYASLEYPSTLLTSIGVTTVQEHTVGFIGTQDGHILKIHFKQSPSAVEYYIHYLYSSTILSDIAFDNNFQHVYVLTQHRLYKVKVQDCNKYTSCSECFSAMDPYCGWCTLEKRCSLYGDCPLSQKTSRWLDVFSDDMCVNITSIEPTNSIAITLQNQITLSVIELPDERNITPAYHCMFGMVFITPAVQFGNVLTCDTPPIDIRPDIPNGQDSVAVQLSVKSMETTIEFVHTEFYFFDCSAHNSCTECAGSNWACDWCIYENKCTHESSACVEDDSSTTVVGENYHYNADTKELNASLIVQWNDNYIIDDIYRYTVTLYDCRVDRLDCSECLSTVTSREELQCGWCVSDNSCQIEQHCDYDWLPQDTTYNCGDPVIYEIWPSSGSFEGGTDIVISGSNLGKTYSHIDSVHIGGRNCILVEERYTGEKLNLASTRYEVTVYIGIEICNVTSIGNTILYCIPPESQPRGVDINGTATINNLPKVMVVVGNLEFFIGYLSYMDQTSSPNIIFIVVSLTIVAFLLLIVIVVVIVIYQRKHINSVRKINDLRRNVLNMDIKLSDIKDENTTDSRGSTAEEELQTPVAVRPNEEVANTCITSDYQTLQPQVTSEYEALRTTLISREYQSLEPCVASQYQSLNKPAVTKQQGTRNYEEIGRSTPDTQPMESK
uniref:Plexin-B-like n=1 Tax=Saccoglossus kowalevskii TaxID=10224 RepID=A0ABM0GIH3_SACKO|nr:PREDICTED: plexin-B-like [Saccoglossus kowalevskii]